MKVTGASNNIACQGRYRPPPRVKVAEGAASLILRHGRPARRAASSWVPVNTGSRRSALRKMRNTDTDLFVVISGCSSGGKSALVTELGFAVDSPLEETGFEPSVPLLRKALLGVANRRRRHERRSHLQIQVRDGDALPGVAPHSLSLRGGTASSNPSSSTAVVARFGCGSKPRSTALPERSRRPARFARITECETSSVRTLDPVHHLTVADRRADIARKITICGLCRG
jgi:hypothetical protein